jgi:hypothetical protein
MDFINKKENTQLKLFLLFRFLILFLFTNVIFLIFTKEENYPFLYLGLFFISSTFLILFSNFFSELFSFINVGFYPSFQKPTMKSQIVETYFNFVAFPFIVNYYQLFAHVFSWNFLKINVDFSVIIFLTIPGGFISLFLFHRFAEIFNILLNIISIIKGVILSLAFARILYSINLIFYSLIFFVPFYIFFPNFALELFTLRNTNFIFLSTIFFLFIGIISSQILPLTKDQSIEKDLFLTNIERFQMLVNIHFHIGLFLYFFPNFNDSFIFGIVLGIFYFVIIFEMVLRFSRNKFMGS